VCRFCFIAESPFQGFHLKGFSHKQWHNFREEGHLGTCDACESILNRLTLFIARFVKFDDSFESFTGDLQIIWANCADRNVSIADSSSATQVAFAPLS
jgi:hypothetical protein